MSWLLAAFMLAIAVPLLFGSWRTAIGALAAQAVLLALIVGAHVREETLASVLPLMDLAVLRAVAAPLLLVAVVRRAGPPRRFELLPANLFHWAAAFALVLAGAAFAARIGPKGDAVGTLHLGVAAVEVLLGLLLLCCHTTPLGQTLGALTVENGVLLFEVSAGHHLPAGVQLGVSAVFAGFVVLAAGFVQRGAAPPAAAPPDGDLL